MKTNHMKLKAALEAVRLERLFQDFADEAIGDDILNKLNESDLEKLGVIKLGDRKRLLAIFQNIAPKTTITETPMVEVRGGALPPDSDVKGTEVKTFLIGRFPVMQEEWEWVRIWGIYNGYEIKSARAETSTCPVTHVTWYDAVKWCNAKSEHEGFTAAYQYEGSIYRKGAFGPSGSKLIRFIQSADGYRLPTEAEWVWAAGGGLPGQRQILNAPEKIEAPEDETGAENVTALQNLYNELGIYNMTSNVWEWCWDMDDSDSAHRIRSTIWSEDDKKGKMQPRISRSPDSRLSILGFRLARNAV